MNVIVFNIFSYVPQYFDRQRSLKVIGNDGSHTSSCWLSTVPQWTYVVSFQR